MLRQEIENLSFLTQFDTYKITPEKLDYFWELRHPGPKLVNKHDPVTLLDFLKNGSFTHGGYGNIYAASLNGEDAIVKILQPQSLYANYVLSRNNQEKFSNEVAAMKELQSPYIVKFLGVVQFDSIPGMVIKRYVGSLADRIRDSKELKESISLEQQLKWAKQISEGLAEIHKKGWLHNDIRADNIFLDEKNNAVIADFGEACHESAAPKVVKRIDGEEPYFPLTRYNDIYSLGLLFWQTMMGRRFSGQNDIFKEIVQDCWNDDPTKRSTAKKIADQLQSALDELLKSKQTVQPLLKRSDSGEQFKMFGKPQAREEQPRLRRKDSEELLDILCKDSASELEMKSPAFTKRG